MGGCSLSSLARKSCQSLLSLIIVNAETRWAYAKIPAGSMGLLVTNSSSARTLSGGARTEFRYGILQDDPDSSAIVVPRRLL